MSVTFSCNDVPHEKKRPYEDEPDYEVSEPVAPFFEINLANGNAADFLDMLAAGNEELYGKWDSKQLPKVQARLCELLYTDAKAQFLEPTMKVGGIIHCGRDIDYVEQRLTQFLKLVTLAIVHGKTISWG